VKEGKFVNPELRNVHLLVVAHQAPDIVESLKARGLSWTLCERASAGEAGLKQRLTGRPFTGVIVAEPSSDQDLQSLREQASLKRTPILVLQAEGWWLSAPDQCSRASVDLLIDLAQGRHAKVESAPKKVLVVDDVAVNRKLLGGFLKQLGHSALFASNGREALKLLKGVTPDLILMDVEMPELGGLETTYKLRSLDTDSRDCPVLAVTGHSSHQEHERCLAAGMNDVLVKPLSKDSLQEAVAQWASRRIAHTQPILPDPSSAQAPVSLEQLQSDVNSDQTQLATVITSFLEDVEKGFPEVDQAIRDKNFAAIRKWAHSVQGAASYFGAERLEGLAQSLEVLSEESHGSLVEGIYDSFLKEWDLVKSFLQKRLKTSGVLEVEILAPLNLEREQLNLIEMHSFLNIMNVVAAELQNVQEVISADSDLQGCLDVFDDFSLQLRQPETVESALESFSEIREKFWSSFDPIRAKDNTQDREAFESARENLRSIFQVIERRCSDLLDRLQHPNRWERHSIEDILGNTRQMLAAVEKNAKGRYHIVYNIAAQEAGDYLVHLDIKSVDGEVIVMPAVFVDVLRDLIANSRKYTEAGGTIQAGLLDDGKFVRLAVEDSGRGIPRHEISKVVGYGYRAGNVADKPTMGAGFGLTKAFWATKKFGGRMWIRSELGQGTRVTIQLPSRGRKDTDQL